MSFKLSLSYLLVLLPLLANAQNNTQDHDSRNLDEDDVGASSDQFIPPVNNQPININLASAQELRALNVLSGLQISNLLDHLKKNGKLLHLAELQSVLGFDVNTINKLLPLITIESNPITMKGFTKQIKEAKQMIITRADRLIQRKEGFVKNKYEGDQNRYYLKYQFKNKYITAGITSEKDPGERIYFKNKSKGMDFNSAHILATNIGKISQLIIGDYKIEVGQGLSLWSDFSLGKSTDILQLKRNAQKIIPYRSTNENRFMRGFATTIEHKDISLTTFFSQKKIDANLLDQDTSLSNITYSSYLQDGMHRTEDEILDRKRLRETIWGGYLSLDKKKFHAGITYANSTFQGTYSKGTKIYNQFELQKNHNEVIGIDYDYFYKNIVLFGEVSKSINGGFALLTSSIISLNQNLSLIMLYRNYERDYHNQFANAIGENSKNSNESGFIVGFESKFNKRLSINGYYDIFRFPWLKYQVNTPSFGHEFILKILHSSRKNIKTQLRYVQKNKLANESSEGSDIRHSTAIISRNMRFHVAIPINTTLTLRSRIEYKLIDQEANTLQGFIVFQDLIFRKLESPISYSFRYLLFQTDNYETRLYTYENDLPYSYSISGNFYQGSKCYFLVKYRLNRKISAWVKLSRTNYINQTEIGSGLDLINGNKKSELKVLVKYSF